MDRWEYFVSRFKVLAKEDGATVECLHLNKIGADGWRLVQVVEVLANTLFAERHYYFERRVIQVPVSARLERPKEP